MDTEHSGLGEQALNKTVEAGLSSQMDAVEDLEADIHTTPGKLLKGELDSASIKGRGMVMDNDLRTELLSVQTNGIAVDPLKAAFGNIKLTRPTNASMVVTLMEEDIERALNSHYLDQKLQNLEVHLNGQPTQITPQRVSFRLPEEGRVEITAIVTLADTQATRTLTFNAVPEVGPEGHQVLLKQVEVNAADGAPKALIDSLLQSLSQLLDIRNFALEGMRLQLQSIDTQPGNMEFTATAHLDEMPF